MSADEFTDDRLRRDAVVNLVALRDAARNRNDKAEEQRLEALIDQISGEAAPVEHGYRVDTSRRVDAPEEDIKLLRSVAAKILPPELRADSVSIRSIALAVASELKLPVDEPERRSDAYVCGFALEACALAGHVEAARAGRVDGARSRMIRRLENSWQETPTGAAVKEKP
jgi:hypothetical protein